ncbi:gamma carbonic anhydrase family protein [Candidatus Bathyarchaeota archaeon]|nr:gamma carbonic anhydrase family protein [Candidatus Bathyarchaeota archaeon]MBS7630289.1 gamma carbonic anhydrase family protein [Candidatus Bathyarchaeota archaeon]
MSKVEYNGDKPEVHESVFQAPGSWIIGKVIVREKANIWNGAVIRGDDDRVVIGARTTILENAIIEAPSGSPVIIGEDTIISHGAIVHGAKIGKNVLIGIGAIVLDKAEIGDGVIIGSGALVPPKTIINPNQLAIGIPAKPIREVSEEDKEMLSRERERTLSKAEKYKKIYAKI